MAQRTAYSNKFCRIVYRGTLVVLISKKNLYNDQYFNSLSEAKKFIGATE